MVAGVIRDDGGRVLLSLRPPQAEQGNLWEFPGGKLQAGEPAREALARELDEELGIEVRRAAPLIAVAHRYPAREVLLDVWEVRAWSGTPAGREGQAIRWVEPEALRTLSFPAANYPVLAAARLPRLHLVTPEPGPLQVFLDSLERALARGARLVQLRAHDCHPPRYRELARTALAACRRHGARLILNAPPALVRELGADGVHLSRAALLAAGCRPLPPDLLVSAACHDPPALVKAAAIGADFALVSPVRPTRTHPGAEPLGWRATATLVAAATLPVYALGGVSPADLPEALRAGCQGVAGIRGLWEGDAALDDASALERIAV